MLLSFVLFIINTHVTFAQKSNTEDKNYKHYNTVHKQNTTTFEPDTISLTDQKTHKKCSRKYIIAPSDSLPSRNMQEKNESEL